MKTLLKARTSTIDLIESIEKLKALLKRWINKTGSSFIAFLLTLISALLISKTILIFDIRIALAFIITLSFVVLIVTNFKRSVDIYIALTYLLPFSSKILSYYTQSILKYKILGGIADVLLGLIILGYIFKHLYYKEKIIKDRVDWFVLAYIGWSLIEIFNPNTNLILGIYAARGKILPMFMYFIAREYFNNFNDIKRFLKIILFFSISDIIYGLSQILFGFTSFDLYTIHAHGLEIMYIWNSTGYIGFHKLFSLSGGSYDLFYPLAVFAILFIGFDKNIMAYFRINRLKNIFLLLVFILFSFLIERTPVIMVVIGYLVTRIDFRSVKSFLKAGIIFIIFYSLLVISIPLLEKTGKYNFHRFAELANPFAAETIQSRAQSKWQPARSLISKKYILGHGLGLFSQTTEAKRQNKYLIAPHNWYYKELLESGIVGLILFIVLYLKLFKELIIYIKGNDYFVGFAKALMGITIAVLLVGYANLPLIHHLGIFFWSFWGFFVLLKNKEINENVITIKHNV